MTFENEPLKISVVPAGSTSVPISKSSSTKGKVGLHSSKLLNNSSERQPSVDTIVIPDREPIRQFDSRKDTELASPLTESSSPRKIAAGAGNMSRESSVIIKSRSGTILQRQNSRQGASKKHNTTVLGAGSTTERSSNAMNTSILVTDRAGSPISPLLHSSATSTARPSVERGSAAFSIVDQALTRYQSKNLTGTSQPSAEELSTSRHQELFRSTATNKQKKHSEAVWKRNLQESQISGKVKLSLLRRDSERQMEKSEADGDGGLLIDTAINRGEQGVDSKNSQAFKQDDASTDRPKGNSYLQKLDQSKQGYYSRGGVKNGSSLNSNVFKSRDRSPESPLLPAKPSVSSDPKQKRFFEGKSSSLTRGDSTGKSTDSASQAYYLGKLETRGSNSRQSGQRFVKSPSLADAPANGTELDSPKFKVSVSKAKIESTGTHKEVTEIRLIKNHSLVEHRNPTSTATGTFRSTVGPGSHWIGNSSSQAQEDVSSQKKDPAGLNKGRSMDSKVGKEVEPPKMRSTMNHSFLNKFNLENVIKKLKAEETNLQNEGHQTSTQMSANHSTGQHQQSNYLAVNTTSKQAFKRTNRGRGTKNNLLRSVFPNNNVTNN